jgi:DNA-binding NtrC family response regulator
VLVCESAGTESPSLHSAIAALGFETIHCPTLDDCLRSTAASQPDVVLVVLPDGSDASVSLLQLMRRAIPATPLVIVAPNATLETRARCHPLRPYYFAVPPIATDELRAVIHGAIESASPRT